MHQPMLKAEVDSSEARMSQTTAKKRQAKTEALPRAKVLFDRQGECHFAGKQNSKTKII